MSSRTVSIRLIADIGSFISGLTRAGAAASGFGGVAGKALGAAGLLGGFTAAISASANFEQAMSGVQAATMASASTMGELREAALRAGADTAFSAGEAAAAIKEMAKAGVSTADILDGGLSGALALAAAGQMDVAAAAGIASTAMVQFNLTGAELPHVADLLAAGAGKAMGEVSDLGAALGQAGLVASAAGLSIEETTGTLAAFASAGLIGSDAGTSLKTMLQRLQNPSDEAARTMADLGISMYDANGEFVGMDALAGQLKGGMENMTPAARDAAMAVIFGSDAVRAANVLYKNGAQGIGEWTAKVNDAGYAAEQARILQDNLKGDLEKLGGAFDLLMIGMGEGSQGPLRDVVQGLTGLVGVVDMLFGWLSNIPGPILAGAAAMAVMALAGGAVTAGIAAMGGVFTALASRVIAATVSMAAFRAAAGAAVGVMGGPLGIALIAGTVLIAGIASSFQKATAQTDAWANSLAEGGAAAASIAAEAQAIRDKQPFDWMADLDEWTGLAPTVDEARQSLEDYRATLDPVAEAQSRVSEWTNTLAYRMGELGNSHEDTKTAQERLAYWTDVLAGRQETLDVATASATTTSLGAAEAMRDFAAEASEADAAVDALQAALDELTGKEITAMEAEIALEEAVASATGAMDNLTGSVLNGAGGLNAQSDAGRKAAGVLIDVRDKGNAYIATLKQQGATDDVVAAAEARLRQSFINSASAMGIGAAQADRLADQILGIPSERSTRITANTGQAMGAISDVQLQLASLRDKTILIRAQKVGSAAGFNSGGGFASGGYTGDGGKYDEAGPVHRREFVFDEDMTSRHRAVFEAIHRGATPRIAASREFPGGGRSGGGGGSPAVSVGGASVHVYIDGRELRGMARVEADGAVGAAMTGMADRALYKSPR